jgi:hypothetical protein
MCSTSTAWRRRLTSVPMCRARTIPSASLRPSCSRQTNQQHPVLVRSLGHHLRRVFHTSRITYVDARVPISSSVTFKDALMRVHSHASGSLHATSKQSTASVPDRSCVARKDASKINCHGPSLEPTSLQLTSKPSIPGTQYSQHAPSTIAFLDNALWRVWAYTSNARTRISEKVAQS